MAKPYVGAVIPEWVFVEAIIAEWVYVGAIIPEWIFVGAIIPEWVYVGAIIPEWVQKKWGFGGKGRSGTDIDVAKQGERDRYTHERCLQGPGGWR